MTLVYLRCKFWLWVMPVMAMILCVSVAWTQPGHAQTTPANAGPQWYPMVRPNLSSHSIACDPKNPNIVYDGGVNGIFKSTDGGNNWRTINNGLANVNVNALVIDPVTTTTIYAGTDAGIFKSVDGGSSWISINNNIKSLRPDIYLPPAVISLAIDPKNPSIVYSGSKGQGLYYSSDAGNSWTPIGDGLPNAFVQAIAIDPNVSSTMYLVPKSAGIFKSSDGGLTWVPSFSGINLSDLYVSGLNSSPIYTLSIDPADSSRVFAGTSRGIYRSLDSGATWSPANNGIPVVTFGTIPVYSILFDPQDHLILYAASSIKLYKSSDGGDSWVTLGKTKVPSDVSTIAISSVPPYPLFAGTGAVFSPGNGVFRSLNRGVDWQPVNSGAPITIRFTPGFAISASQPTRLFATTSRDPNNEKRNLQTSADSGRNWTNIGAQFDGQILLSIAVDPKTASTIYASAGDSLYKSDDAGLTWTLILKKPQDQINLVVIDPNDTNVVYANANSNGIFKSIDGGLNWNRIAFSGGGNRLSINPNDSNTIFAASDDGLLFRSFDAGLTYAASRVSYSVFDPINTIVFDHISPALVYYAGRGGFYKSTDSGSTWTNQDHGYPGATMNMVAQDPTNPEVFYAATDMGIFRTSNTGVDWTKSILGIPADKDFRKIMFNPGNSSVLYAVSSDGVLYTTDPAVAGAPTPASGWWWNPAEPGRGVGLEISSSGALRLGLFGFDDSGFSHWWTASGTLDSSGNFSSDLIDAEFGNPLGAPQRAAQTASVGAIGFAATSDSAGTLTLPNGSQVPIQRYEFTRGGLAAAPDTAAPKTGWWTSPNAPGQYFFIEVQNGAINASALSFDIDAGPVWYSDQTSAVAAGVYGGAWQELIGGQTLSSPYRAPKVLSNAAAASLRFSSPTSGSLIFGNTILPISWTGP